MPLGWRGWECGRRAKLLKCLEGFRRWQRARHQQGRVLLLRLVPVYRMSKTWCSKILLQMSNSSDAELFQHAGSLARELLLRTRLWKTKL